MGRTYSLRCVHHDAGLAQDRDLYRGFARYCLVKVGSVSEVPHTITVRLRMQTLLDIKLRCVDVSVFQW